MEFLKSAKVVSALTFASRIFGLVRDIGTTAILSTRHTDALFLAWTIPNLFRKLFGEGALSSAFIPAFVRVQGNGTADRLKAFTSNVITTLTMVLSALMALFLVLSFLVPESWLLPLFQGSAEKMSDTLALARILIPYMLVSCVIAQFQGILNSLKEFTVPALAPILLNVVWIAATALAAVFADDSGARVFIISWGILFAGAMQVALFVPSLARHGLVPRFHVDWKDKDFRGVIAMTAPMVVALSANQLNVLVDRLVVQAYVPGDGGVTHLYVGIRLMQFPLALIGIALVTAVFPLLARLSSAGDREGMKRNLNGAIRINLFLSIPAMAGLAVLAEPIIRLLFERGNFDASDTAETCRALIGYTAGLPFLSTVMLLTRAFYSMGRWKAPLYSGAILVVLNVALDFILVVPLAEAGVALATSFTVAVQALVLFIILRRGVGKLGGTTLVSGALRSCVLSVFLGAVVFAADQILGGMDVADGFLWRVARVGLPILAGMVVYFLPARILCPFEFNSIVDAFRSRSTRSSGKSPADGDR